MESLSLLLILKDFLKKMSIGRVLLEDSGVFRVWKSNGQLGQGTKV